MDTKKLTSVLELVAGLNYLLTTGVIKANNKDYIATVNAYKKENKKPLSVKITKTKSGVIFAGDKPELGDNIMTEEYLIDAPVMINLAINTLGARHYGVKIDQARMYKLSINEQMCLTEDDYNSVIGKIKKLEGSANPLPTSEDIKDFKWLEPTGDAAFVHTSNRKASVNKEKGMISSGTNSNNTSATKPVLSAEELVRRVSKTDKDKSTKGIIRPTLLKTDDKFDVIEVGKYRVYVADENTGQGYFNHVYVDNYGENNYFTIEYDKEAELFKVIFQDNNALEQCMTEAVLILAKGESTGESIHSVKNKDKKDLVYNTSSYKVYRR